MHIATKISVGVFGPRKASIVARIGLPGTFYKDGGTHDTDAGSWHLSTSYDPNPVVKTGREIKTAIADVARLMKPYYDLFNNNCQTFAREVMGRLGSVHTRDPYH